MPVHEPPVEPDDPSRENRRTRRIVEIGPERLRRQASDLWVECPRCGRRTFMRHTRCQHCGLWFEGEAFQFAPSDLEGDRARSRWMLLGAGALLLLLASIAAMVVVLLL